MSLLRKLSLIIFWSFFSWSIVAAFAFKTYRIPSDSMQGILFNGDYVLINKLRYGARFPITPLSFKINGVQKYIDWRLPYIRIPGYRRIMRNDVVAFNFALGDEQPVDLRQEYIKRCVAVPGDSLLIKNGDVFINGKQSMRPQAYYRYRLQSKAKVDSSFFNSKKIVIVDHNPQFYDFEVLMSENMVNKLTMTGLFSQIKKSRLTPDEYTPAVFPHNGTVKWNVEFFGPMYIPKLGDSIEITEKNIIIYGKLIERFEGSSIAMIAGKAMVDATQRIYYQFKNNYFFMLGDNTTNSIDSRFVGLIPEDHIIGKASYILYSSEEKDRKFLIVE